MRKVLLLLGICFLIAPTANAGIVSNILKNKYYNDGYYYPPNAVRYAPNPNYYNPNYYNQNYYNRRYYQPQRYYNQYPQNYYYNQQPIIYRSNFNKSSADNNEKYVSNQFDGIDKIERQILFQTYEYDSVRNRIERLESKIFGAIQPGSLEERVIVLKSAAKNYKTFNPEGGFANMQRPYNSYTPPIFTGSTGTSWKNNMLGNLRNQLTGTPTGFTPAMDPAYMDWFEAERAMMGSGQSVDYRTNTGYRRSNTSRGSSTGVAILD